MRILHVINSMGRGGAERELSNLLGPLHQMGVENDLVTLRADRDFDDRVRPFVDRYIAGVLHLGRRSAITDLVNVARRADVVHTHLPQSDILGRLAASAARKPAVTTWHSTMYGTRNMLSISPTARRKLGALRFLDEVTAQSARRFFAVSEATRDSYVSALGINPDRVMVTPNAIDLSEFDPARFENRDKLRTTLGYSQEELTILIVARFYPQKDHATAIRAVTQLKTSHPVRLVIVGSGPLEKRLKSLAAELDAPVSFLGQRDDIPALMFSSDIFLLPTFYEGWSMSLMEAMAMALPCICSDIPENIEVAGDAALYVRPGDPDALAQSICRLAQDEQLRATLGIQAHTRAQNFDAMRSAAALIRSIQEVI